MVAIASGLWWDYSRPAVEAATLTLPWNLGNVLLSGLTLLVTIAGNSFWNVAAFVLHTLQVSRSAKAGRPISALSLQHRVILRNSPGPVGSAWEAVKICSAWSSTRVPRLWVRTLAVVCPAVIIRASFAAAAILVSRVANQANGSVVARLEPENCGWWFFDANNISDATAGRIKMANDTILARTYVSNFYANTTTSSTATSLFIQPTLPYTTNTSAPCPIPASERCIFGENGAFGMKTDMLNSQEHLGINAPAGERLGLQISVACSQINYGGLRLVDNTSETFTFGGFRNSDASNNATYSYFLDTEQGNVGYMLVPFMAFAGQPGPWIPIPELNRTDADVSVFFLSQNAVSYLGPVHDRFFLATQEVHLPGVGSMFLPDSYVHVMVCAEQYAVCNPPDAASCRQLGGWNQLRDAIFDRANKLGLNAAQRDVAARLLIALVNSNMYSSVEGLGAGALWANNLAGSNLSPGLPDNQWQAEVLGWFQTSLAKIQAYTVDYASNNAGLSPHGTFQLTYRNLSYDAGQDEGSAALRRQCENQLVRTAGGVQNFNFIGVVVIVVASVFLVLLDLALPRIVSFAARHSRLGSAAETARRADTNLHLLRLALGGPDYVDGRLPPGGWRRGRWDVPVLEGDGRSSGDLRAEEQQPGRELEGPAPQVVSVNIGTEKTGHVNVPS